MTGGLALEAWYNGKVLTIAAHNDKVFAQAPMPETIDRTLDALAERYDMAPTLADLVHSSAEKALLSATTARYQHARLPADACKISSGAVQSDGQQQQKRQ